MGICGQRNMKKTVEWLAMVWYNTERNAYQEEVGCLGFFPGQNENLYKGV